MMEQKNVLKRVLMIATVALIGLNLRPFMTSIGPLASSIHEHTALGLQGMAFLTLIPMLLMGLLAFTGPALAVKIGARRAVILALLVIGLGCALRITVESGWTLIGTAAISGLGVAIVQAVFPGIIKREFTNQMGPMMGLYSAMLMGGGALGALIAPAVETVTGNWKLGLAFFAIPALIAALLAIAFLPTDVRTSPARNIARTFLARPRTWLLILCFGLVNGGYSSVVAWLAPAYQEQGWSGAASANLLATLAASQALAALSLPMFARKRLDRRPWLWITLALQAIGFAGLAFAPNLAPYTLAAILGAGLGGSFALTLIVALDHLPEPTQAGALTALMQGGGFIIAAIPAWLVAALHDLTSSYLSGWAWHLACVSLVAILTLRLNPKSYASAMPSLINKQASP